MSAHLVAGRFFDDNDRADTAPVVIVDDLLAHSAWPGIAAVGRRLHFERYTGEEFAPASAVVVGVVQHMQHHSLTNPVRGQIYIPYTQSPREHLSFVVRTRGNPESLAASVRRQMWATDRSVAIAKLLPMASYVRRAGAPVDFNALLAAVFGILGLVLAGVGVYSVVSYTVSQRKREFGVRMAVGADAAAILRLVIGETLLLTSAGIALGAGCALLLTQYLRSLLFGVTAADPASYGVAGAVIALASLAAGCIPAARAASGSVISALRLE
ncbi:MAG TPA: FtsX-like permease family protein [Bryobacteraceae bacterium]|nr:FtsX-like permease family protein [Bryobacteraceae bacterium]